MCGSHLVRACDRQLSAHRSELSWETREGLGLDLAQEGSTLFESGAGLERKRCGAPNLATSCSASLLLMPTREASRIMSSESTDAWVGASLPTSYCRP